MSSPKTGAETVPVADPGRPASEAPRSLPGRLRRRLAAFGKRKLALVVAALLVFAATALVFGPRGIVPLGLLIAYIADPDETLPSRSIALTRRNLALSALCLAVFAVLALDPAYLGRLPGAVFSLLLVVPLVLPLFLQESADRGSPAPARTLALTRRNLVLALWALLIFTTLAYRGGLLLDALAPLLLGLPLTLMASRAFAARRGALEYGLLREPLRRDLRAHVLQALNVWVFCSLLGAMIAAGSVDIARLEVSSNAFAVLVAALWVGLVLLAALALVPRGRVYVATNMLVALLSGFLALQVGRISAPPTDVKDRRNSPDAITRIPHPVTGG